VALQLIEDHHRSVFRRRFPFAFREGGELNEADGSTWGRRAARWRFDYPDAGSEACLARTFKQPNGKESLDSYDELLQQMTGEIAIDTLAVAAPVARDRITPKTLGGAQRWLEQMRGTAPQLSILVSGLNNVGKTTMIFCLDTANNTGHPLVGMIGHPVTSWYLGNANVGEMVVPFREKMRPLYRQYYQMDCICWVINACSTLEELDISGKHLHVMLNEIQMIKAGMAGVDMPILIVVNRLKHPEAHTLDQVIKAHYLNAFEDAPHCFGSYLVHVVEWNDVYDSQDLRQGFQWLEGVLPEFKLDGTP